MILNIVAYVTYFVIMFQHRKEISVNIIYTYKNRKNTILAIIALINFKLSSIYLVMKHYNQILTYVQQYLHRLIFTIP